LILLLTEGHPIGDVRIACRAAGQRLSRRRQALSKLDITQCIPGRKKRKAPTPFDTKTYQQRNLIERMFGMLKDWRRIATRFDRCAHTFMSAICIATIVIFWL
jgi:transposase